MKARIIIGMFVCLLIAGCQSQEPSQSFTPTPGQQIKPQLFTAQPQQQDRESWQKIQAEMDRQKADTGIAPATAEQLPPEWKDVRNIRNLYLEKLNNADRLYGSASNAINGFVAGRVTRESAGAAANTFASNMEQENNWAEVDWETIDGGTKNVYTPETRGVLINQSGYFHESIQHYHKCSEAMIEWSRLLYADEPLGYPSEFSRTKLSKAANEYSLAVEAGNAMKNVRY